MCLQVKDGALDQFNVQILARTLNSAAVPQADEAGYWHSVYIRSHFHIRVSKLIEY
jgi:hypothetical protein